MAAFKFNLQQLDLTGAYDRYTKELEEQKKQELYDNKLVEQEIDNYNKYYSTKNMRDQEVPLLKSSFDEFKNASNAYNKAIRRGDVDAANAANEKRRKATVDMGDIYKNSSIANNTFGQLSNVKKKEVNGELVVDDEDFNQKIKLFSSGSLEDIKKLYGSSDTWGDVANTVSLTNNKYNENLSKTITAFNSNKNNYITGTSPIEYQTQKLDNGDEFKIPIFEKVPDYNKALQLAIVQPEAMKKKIIQQLNAELAQGGAISDTARIKQDKVAKIFGKTPDQLTANDLLAYQIAGDIRKEADLKQGKATWEMNMDNAKFKYKQELDKKKAEIAKAKAANKGKGGKVTAQEITLVKNYYDASKGGFADNQGNLKAGKEVVFKSFLDGLTEDDGTPNKVIQFFHKLAPKSKTDINEMNKVFQGYMKNPQSLYGAMQ